MRLRGAACSRWLHPVKWPQKSWIFPLKMVIFHSYVSLPEGSILAIGGAHREFARD